MKRIHILLAAALTLFACSKSEIPVYRLEDSAVCFQSVNNNFSMRSLTEPTRDLTIPVVLIGQVTDYARPISFSRDGGTAVEGQDYTLVSAEVPAGSLTGSIVLRANRLEGITEKTLDLTIQPNEHFREGYPAKLKDGDHVVLNTADTTQLMKVPGIGSYYAKEIIRHGKWIGGYVSVDQLDEIEGFPPTAKKYFVVSHPTPQRLNINKLTLQQLRRHPYINYVDYRRLYGDIKSLQDLRFSKDFPEDAIQRLEPYVEY